MKGTVRKRGTTWSYQFSVGHGERRRHVQRGGYRLKSDAQAALTAALAAYAKGDRRVTMSPSAELLSDYLSRWLDERGDLKPSTLQGYRTVATNFIGPELGDVRLKDLTPARIVKAYTSMRKRGGRRGKPLSDRSVQLTHAVLRSALEHAVEQGDLASNPAATLPRTSLPRVREKREMKVWSANDAAAFLAHTADDRLGACWALALDSGMRRGELLGLRWRDVNFETGVISVRRNRVSVDNKVVEGTTKSGKARTVDLSAGTVASLRRWRTRQREERLAWGEAYENSGYVFTSEDGAPLRPEALAWQFRSTLAKAPVPTIRFHDMRHTSATLDLEANVHPKVVQERLGHSNIAMTLDLYSHVIPGMGANAANLRGELLYGAS